MLNDRIDINTRGYRLRLRLYCREAGGSVRKESDNPMDKAILSRREEAEFNNNSIIIDTHNPVYGRI